MPVNLLIHGINHHMHKCIKSRRSRDSINVNLKQYREAVSTHNSLESLRHRSPGAEKSSRSMKMPCWCERADENGPGPVFTWFYTSDNSMNNQMCKYDPFKVISVYSRSFKKQKVLHLQWKSSSIFPPTAVCGHYEKFRWMLISGWGKNK